MMEMFNIRAVQCGSHWSHVTTEHFKCGVTEVNFKFYLTLINLKLK